MADVFLSYRRSDIERVRWMIDSLLKNNISVWYDLELNAGTHFALEIARQVETCRAMLVIWSEESVKSLFVLDEASEGKDREILVPVRIDPIKPPFGFRQIQAPLLESRDEHHPEWQRVINTLKLRCKQQVAALTVQPTSTTLKTDDAKEAIKEMIVVYLNQKSGRQTLAAVSHAVKRAYPAHCSQNNWFGKTKFKDFVESLNIPGVKIENVSPGYLVLQQEAPSEPGEQSGAVKDPLLARLFRDTYAPRLSQRQFSAAIEEIFSALKERDLLRPRTDLSVSQWNSVVSRARDALKTHADGGIGMNRLRPILLGMRYGGLGATDAPQSSDDLRLIYAFELAKQCGDAGKPLTEAEFDRVLELLGGTAGHRPQF